MAAPDYTLGTTVFVAKWGTDDPAYNFPGAPMARLTIARALLDLADTARYLPATATAPKSISVENGVYSTPAFALPPFVFVVGNPDGPTDPTGGVVLNMSGNITAAAAWSVNQTAFGGFEDLTIRNAEVSIMDLTMPAPAAGNPARTITLRNIRTDLDSVSWEATSSADVLHVTDLIQDGTTADVIEFSAGAQIINGITSAAPITLNDTAALAASINAKGIYTVATPSAVAPGLTITSTTGGMLARLGNCDNRALAINRSGAAAITVYADATSIPLTANLSYGGTATTANLIRTTDTGGVSPSGGTGVFFGLNGQTITGDANGAWAITCNGLVQNVTLTPSTTGKTLLHTNTANWQVSNDRYLIGPTGSIILLGTGTDSANGRIQIAAHTTSAGGIGFGPNTSLYTPAAGKLSIDHLGGTDPQLLFAASGTEKARFEQSGASGGFFISTSIAQSLVFRTNLTNALTLDASQNATFAGTVTKIGGAFLLQFSSALTDGAAAQVGTLTNAPTAGNPTKWIAINDNGTTRRIPAW